MSNVIVVGGGAAGMMAAVFAARNGQNVQLLEKNEKLGKKLFITGKGRCNITNAADIEDLFTAVTSNPKFLYSGFYSFTNQQVIDFFEELGVKTKIERGERVFPVSDHSSDVIAAFSRELKSLGVAVSLHTEVRELLCEQDKVCGVLLTNGKKMKADAVIVATGGISYPSTGSTGDGYRFARETGHRVTELLPSLVPMEVRQWYAKELQGLSLRNIEIRITDGKKKLYEEFGEMLFTHYGVTGPVILSASSVVGKTLRKKELTLHIDLKPALSEEQLDKRILREFDANHNKQFKNAGVEESSLAVGTWAIGGQNYGAVDRNDSIKAIRTMLDCGVNLIDTAPCYGNGSSEKIVGEAIQGLKRDEILISTKFGLITDVYSGGYKKCATYQNTMREVESSLMNLGSDYIDFYFVHWPDVNTPIDETMAALANLKKQGKIRFVGVSNFSEEQIEEAEKYLQIDVQQPPFSMVNRTFVDLMKWGAAKGIDSMTYGSLGSGILSGAIRTLPDFAPNDLRLTFYDFFKEPKFSKIMELLKVMDQIAESHKRPVAQVAVNWSTQKDYVGTALVGVRNEQEARENCAAFDWELTDQEIQLLDDEIKRLGI